MVRYPTAGTVAKRAKIPLLGKSHVLNLAHFPNAAKFIVYIFIVQHLWQFWLSKTLYDEFSSLLKAETCCDGLLGVPASKTKGTGGPLFQFYTCWPHNSLVQPRKAMQPLYITECAWKVFLCNRNICQVSRDFYSGLCYEVGIVSTCYSFVNGELLSAQSAYILLRVRVSVRLKMDPRSRRRHSSKCMMSWNCCHPRLT